MSATAIQQHLREDKPLHKMPAMTQSSEKTAQGTISHIRRKTVVSLLRTWQEVRGTALHAIGMDSPIRPSLPKPDIKPLKEQMQSCFESPGGEITARAHTAELGRIYLGLNEDGRGKFLRLLAEDFDVDHAQIATIAQKYAKCEEGEGRLKLEMELRQALVSPRSTILRQFTALPDGFKFLVNLRADLMPLIGKDAKLAGLEYDLKSILSSWFDVGLLDLVELTWNSPAAVLEKLIEYEAVHRVNSWDDLKNRLDADRRVFAFFHNKMPTEPLIFVHVALVEGMSDNVQALLDEASPLSDAAKADTAIFYSISNAQKGLAGISFGNFLIKRVVAKLSEEMPHIKTFATLSPIPSMRSWLDPQLTKGDEKLLTSKEATNLRKLSGEENAAQGLKKLLDTAWHKDSKLADALKPTLMRLCAKYLLEAKGKDGVKPLDPVSNFHLFNGARLERLNWLGDTSSKGMKQAAGMMVNYHYKLSHIDENHEEFVTNGKIVAARQVRSYAE